MNDDMLIKPPPWIWSITDEGADVGLLPWNDLNIDYSILGVFYIYDFIFLASTTGLFSLIGILYLYGLNSYMSLM